MERKKSGSKGKFIKPNEKKIKNDQKNNEFDPRFKAIAKNKKKVQVSDRFKEMFENEAFRGDSGKLKIDKYGLPKKQKNQKHLLEKVYELEKSEDQDQEEDEIDQKSEPVQKKKQIKKPEKKPIIKNKESSSEGEEAEEEGSNSVEDPTGFHWSAESSSESTDIETEEEVEEVEEEKEDIPDGEETARIAVVNLDWDNIKSVDLYFVLQSFLTNSSGTIKKISIIPSNYGLEQMKLEEQQGPTGIWAEKQHSDSDSENEGNKIKNKQYPLTRKQTIQRDEETFDQDKLRKYQLNRLKYYFAVVECSDKETALHLYKNCDGIEIGQTSNKFDMRFIPDDIVFEHAPRDEATSAPVDHKLIDFHTKALQHTRVKLTWDQDDPERRKLTKSLHDESIYSDNAFLPLAQERKIAQLIAMSDSESSDDEEIATKKEDEKPNKKKRKKVRQKYSSILSEIHGDEIMKSYGKKNDDIDMEITFTPGIGASLQTVVDKKIQSQSEGQKTPWEEHLEKLKERKNEKRKLRREKLLVENQQKIEDREKNKKLRKKNKKLETVDPELELLFLNDKPKNKSEKMEEGKIDPRFDKIITNPESFGLDRTDPNYKPSAAFIRNVHQERAKLKSQAKSVRFSLYPFDYTFLKFILGEPRRTSSHKC